MSLLAPPPPTTTITFDPRDTSRYINLSYEDQPDVLEFIDWTSLFTSIGVVISGVLAGLYFSYVAR